MKKYLYYLVACFTVSLSLGIYTNLNNKSEVLTFATKNKQRDIAVKIAKEVRAQALPESPITVLTWEDFEKLAVNIAKEYDIPVSVMLGQAAHETGHGTSLRAKLHNNYFGLCAYSDDAPGCWFTTAEESVRFYARLIKYDYKWAYEARDNPREMLRRIWASGYATDPRYVEKVTSTAEFQRYL